MVKILLGSIIVLLFNASLFAQAEDGAVVNPRITLRLNNARLDMILDSFRIKYPAYCRFFFNTSGCQLRCDLFEVKDVSLPAFLKELKRVFPIRGKTTGNCLVISAKQPSQKAIDKIAKEIDKKTAPNTISNACVTHPDTVLIVERTAPLKNSAPIDIPIINMPPKETPIQKADTVSVLCHVMVRQENFERRFQHTVIITGCNYGNFKLLQIHLAYELCKKYHPRLPFKRLAVSIAMNNIAVLCLQNNMGVYPAGRFFNCTIYVTY